ncbi:MAG: DUF4012 domain-containing protein [Candidatus Shapirobacteria bacterium]|nr:DUF4012 domain-containing protein [Candidatus Shapirobacteria bacterium]MDD4410190.1 DUF4012 domain-containing protein [Candidatus Shapirobacteria bacterium]
MNSALPFALIIGIEHFVAKKLAEELSNKDINVIGVGEYVAGLSEIKNFEWLMDLSEVNGKFNYVFDFKGDEDLWKMDQFKGEKITLVCVNNKEKAKQLKNDLDNLNLNWRMVEAEEVYGPGMEENNFLAQAIKQAVVNKNLVLPDLKSKFRILAIEDLVEAILRASFLSGTEKEKFLVLGNKTNSEEVAKVLIDEAKMTRYKVLQEEIEIEEVDEERLKESSRKLRWEAKVDFKNGIKETLQYFFSRADEENRKKKAKPFPNPSLDRAGHEPVLENKPVVKEKTDKRMEVVVEEEVPKEKIKNEEVLEEIESFYKQKKVGMEVLRQTQNEIIPVEREALKEETVDEFFDDEVEEIKPTHSAIAELPSLEKGGLETEKLKPKNKFKWKLPLLFLTIFIILVMPINWAMSTILAVNNIKQNLTLIETKKYKQVEELSDKNLLRIKKIDQQIDDWGLNKLKIIRNYQSLLKIGEDVLKLEKDSIVMSQSADLISQAIFKGRQIKFSEELNKEEEYLNSFENELGLILARLNGDYGWLPAKWRLSLQKQVQELKGIKEKIGLISRGIKILPEMLGLDGKKKEYMVLFQNESELRATGGFIGSYGILSFQGGKLLNFDIKDIYEADGQMKGHVEPPIEIKTYLNEANWYMRDANWNPNFSKASADIQWFLDKEINRKVDGVFGINLAVAKSIIGVIGEVNVPNFDEKITKDNLYEQAEYYSENKFFPGSTQKASFLGALGKQMFENIKELNVKQQLNLVVTLIDLLEKNEIQLAFNNEETAKIAADLGWNGAIYNGKCSEENCFSDYLFVVESNFGVNKSNYFLYRNMEQVVDISANSVGRILKINYENTSKNTNQPAGDYKNYLRVYLPNNVNLSQISLIDGTNSSLKKVYTNDELRIREVEGKKEIGFLATVPVNSKKTVEIRYSTENNLTSKNKFSYLNYVQKQSGFGDTGLVTLVSFPANWQPLQVEPQASMVGGKLLFNQKLDKDIKMGVELGK